MWYRFLVSGDESVFPGAESSWKRIYENWIPWEALLFRQIRVFRKKGPIFKFLQLKMIFMPQWHILDHVTAIKFILTLN